MRRFTCFLCSLHLFFLCSCHCPSKGSGFIDVYDAQGYQLVHLKKENLIFSMYDKKIIYFQNNSKQSEKSISYLDLYTMSEKEIGILESYTIQDNSLAVMDESILFHVGSGPYDDLTTTLYEINLQNNQIKKIYSEKFYQTLVPVKSANNRVFSLKGVLSKEESDVGITYIALLTKGMMHPQSLVEKNLHMKAGIGESILAFDVFDDEMALLVSQDMDGSSYRHLIEVYDMNSKMNHYYHCDYIISHLSNQYISDFILYGNSAFIQNLSSDSIFISLDASSQDLLATANFEYAIYPATVIGDISSPYEIFFAPYSPFLFAFDPASYEFRVLDISDYAPGYSFANHHIYCNGDDLFCILVQDNTVALDIPSSEEERVGVLINLHTLAEAFNQDAPLETDQTIDLSEIVKQKYLFSD